MYILDLQKWLSLKQYKSFLPLKHRVYSYSLPLLPYMYSYLEYGELPEWKSCRVFENNVAVVRVLFPAFDWHCHIYHLIYANPHLWTPERSEKESAKVIKKWFSLSLHHACFPQPLPIIDIIILSIFIIIFIFIHFTRQLLQRSNRHSNHHTFYFKKKFNLTQ